MTPCPPPTGPAGVSRVDADTFSWADPTGTGEAVRRVLAEATAGDGRSPFDEQTMLSLRHSGLSRSSMWVAGTRDQVSGVALVETRSEGPAAPEAVGADGADTTAVAAAVAAEVNLVVAPSARGHGVGRALAETVVAAFPDHRLTAWSHGNHPAAQTLASRLGFERARDLWLMRRSMSGELPAARMPDDIVIRTFRPGADEEAFLAVNAAAFAHHPEQGSMTRADLEHRMSEPWFDPAGFFLAEREDPSHPELLGFHWTKLHPGPPPYGEVYVVGVAPAAQGGGLGKTLTMVGLRHLRAKGVGEVVLYVESDNRPATRTYQQLGFTHAPEDTDVMYQR